LQNSNKTFCFVTNLSFGKEPTVKNRLIPYITQIIECGSSVILVTSDSEVYKDIDSNLFTHILNPSKKNKPSSFFGRTIFEWIEARNILMRVKKIDAEIIILTIPSMFLLFNAYLLKSENMYLDVRDLTWEYLSNKNLIHRASKLFFRLLVNRSIKFFNSIIVSNDEEADFFKKRGAKTQLYPNGVTQIQFENLSSLLEKKNSNFTVSYVGKVGLAQNLETLIGAAKIMNDIKFNIIGYGSEYSRLQNIVLSKGLTNIAFYKNANWEEVLHFYQESDVLYAQLQENYSGAMPSKLYQYLNTGRFVIYGGGNQAKKTLSNFSTNIVIPPCNIHKLVDAIKKVRELHIQKIDINNNLKIIKQNYIRENNVRKIIKECFKI